MAGDDGVPTTNNEILLVEGKEEGEGALARGEPHSRVGGILECDPPGNRNSPSERASSAAATATDEDEKDEDEDFDDEKLDDDEDIDEVVNEEISEEENRNGEVGGGAVCRYALRTATSALSLIEICQIRLQHLFPQLTPPPRYKLCENSIELTAECLANDVIRYLLKEDIYLISRDPVSRSMRHNVYRMLNKHGILFTSMVNRLNIVPDTAYEAFMGVADELFLYSNITWARIVCLYAFMGRLALWARDRRMHSLIKKLPLYVSRYIGEKIAHFIKGYGWEQLCVEYPVAEEVSGAVWRSLLMTGVTLGLVTTILTVTS